MSDMARDAVKEMEGDGPTTQPDEPTTEYLSANSAVAFMKGAENQVAGLLSKLPTTTSVSSAVADYMKMSVRWMKTIKWALVNFASETTQDHDVSECWIHDFLSYAAPNEADVDFTLRETMDLLRGGAEREVVEEHLMHVIDMFGDLMLQTKSAPMSQPAENTALSDACVDLHQYIEKKGWEPSSFSVGVAERPNESPKIFVYVKGDDAASEMRRTMFPHGTVRWQGYELIVKVMGELRPADDMPIKADLRDL
jgi:hypothetical protein